MTLAVQAFRMGAEPFFFNQASEKNAPRTYADVMKYFVIVCCFIFLTVGMFPDIFKIIIGSTYHEGLYIVPILLMANVFLGIYYNQSVWYKLTDKTTFATIIPITGAGITLALNFLLIPKMGYEGSAWATLACYGGMAILSYIIGQKHYAVPYNLRKIFLYLFVSVLFCMLGLQSMNWFENNIPPAMARIFLLGIFFLLAYWMDLKKVFKKRLQ
jgi:O-antigen/teichoic acid export membrane protein